MNIGQFLSNRQEAERIMAALSVYYTEEEARRWVSSPHPLLDGESADKLMERGQFNRIWQILDALDSGAYL